MTVGPLALNLYEFNNNNNQIVIWMSFYFGSKLVSHSPKRSAFRVIDCAASKKFSGAPAYEMQLGCLLISQWSKLPETYNK
jgi:hypothetical protein